MMSWRFNNLLRLAVALIASVFARSRSSVFIRCGLLFSCMIITLSLCFAVTLFRRNNILRGYIMKVLALGVVRMSGTSMKSGSPKPYDMTRISYAVPVQQVDSEKRKLVGYGYETRDVDLDPDALHQFKDVKFPAHLDIDVQVDPANLRRNICVGVKATA